MGRNKGKGRGLPAGMKTRPAFPLEWRTERGSMRPPKWRKTPGRIAKEWDRDSSCQGASTPTELKIFPGGDETSGVTPKGDSVPKKTNRGGEGMETPPPPETPRRAGTLAAARR